MEQSEKLSLALEAYKDLVIANSKLRNHKILANSNIPKHKQAKFDQLVTQCVVKLKNAESAVSAKYKTLSLVDKHQFNLRTRILHG